MTVSFSLLSPQSLCSSLYLVPQFSDFNLKPENRPTLFSFESDLIASEAGPSRGQPVQDDRDQDEDWDPSSYMYDQADYEDGYDQAGPSHANRDSIVDPRQSIAVYSQEEPTVQDTQDDYWEDIDEDESLFINFSLLSHIAVQLRDKIEPKMHVKGSVSYPRSFTGRDIVVRIFANDIVTWSLNAWVPVNHPVADTA